LLLCPGLLIIDHGHFQVWKCILFFATLGCFQFSEVCGDVLLQYNGISLGLALWAFVFILRGDGVLGTVCFCLSLNYKQMALYMAPGEPRGPLIYLSIRCSPLYSVLLPVSNSILLLPAQAVP
jgi:hypothetical protein